MTPIENPLKKDSGYAGCTGRLGHPLSLNHCATCDMDDLEQCKTYLIFTLKNQIIIEGQTLTFSFRKEQLEMTDQLAEEIYTLFTNQKFRRRTYYINVGETCICARLPKTKTMQFKVNLESIIEKEVERIAADLKNKR
jgi:hypothetical protein